MSRLMKTHSLVFIRPAQGYFSKGKWVAGGVDVEIPAIGSLQPFKKGWDSIVLPEGTRTEDAKTFLSLVKLQPANDHTKPVTRSDYTIIDGKRFEIWSFEDWTGFGLRTDHYEYTLVASPPKTDGDGND